MTSSATVFEVGGVVYTWTDVADFARWRGDWELVTEAAAQRKPPRPQEAVDEAARAFRHARRLLSADDLADWLDRRGVTVDRWLAYLGRTLAEAENRFQTTNEVGDEDVWAEAMCSGLFDERARELARMLAVVPGLPFADLDAAFEDFSRSVTTEDAIEREVAAAGLDWMRVRYAVALFATESAAAEASLCVLDDGLAFGDVANTAGVTVSEYDIWLEDADRELAPFFAAARESELVGPVATDAGFLLAEVRQKTQVAVGDPAVRARAKAAVVERAADRATTDHVVWHEPIYG